MENHPITFCYVSTESIKQEQDSDKEELSHSNRNIIRQSNDENNTYENMDEALGDQIGIESQTKSEESCQEQDIEHSSQEIENSEDDLPGEVYDQVKIIEHNGPDLLLRCPPCQRIFVGMDGWMRHKKRNECDPVGNIKLKATPNEFTVKEPSETEQSSFMKEFTWKGPRKCKYCDQMEEKRGNMKNHTLNHYKEKLCNILPPSSLITPFACPICKQEHRDKVTFLRHFGFAEKKIFEFCTEEDLLGEAIDSDNVQRTPKVELNGSKSPKKRSISQ